MAAGACEAARSGTHCILFGPEPALRSALGRDIPEGLELVDAPVGISNRDEPARAVRAKPDASIIQAAKAVAEGRADALVSAGSTGAALAASLLYIKRLRGVHRPAVAVLLPVPGAPVLFLDAGANVEVRADNLIQFAHMGAAFSERVLGVARPRVGLISVGEESAKGTPEVVAAHTELSGGPLNFMGNVEGGDLVAGKADVVVTDGFTGNVTLKAIEGTARVLGGALREAVYSGPLTKLGGLLLKSRFSALRRELDPEKVGGAYLLGLRGLVVICHGSSSRRAIASAIELAVRGVGEQVVEKTAQALAEVAPGRSAAAEGGEGGHDQGPGASVSADTVPAGP